MMCCRRMLSGKLWIGSKRVVFASYGWECLVQHFLVQESLMVWARAPCEIRTTCMAWQIYHTMTAENCCWGINFFILQFVSCRYVANIRFHMLWRIQRAAWCGRCQHCFILDVCIILVFLRWIFVNMENCGASAPAFYINLLISVLLPSSAHLQREDVVAQTGHIFA